MPSVPNMAHQIWGVTKMGAQKKSHHEFKLTKFNKYIRKKSQFYKKIILGR